MKEYATIVIFYVISLHAIANHNDDYHYQTVVNIIRVLPCAAGLAAWL